MKPAIEIKLITSTTCNLRCPGCPGGRKEDIPGGVMKLEMLARILAKCTAEANVMVAQLYYYNEPFLLKELPDMVLLCHAWGIPVLLSSNLTGPTTDRIGPLLKTAPEKLMISVSGWSQAVYERYHVGGNIEEVKRNIVEVAKTRDRKTEVVVCWHRHSYNAHELTSMRNFSRELGLKFVAYGTTVLSQKLIVDAWKSGKLPTWADDLEIGLEESRQLCLQRKHWDCLEQTRRIVINSEGNLMFCACESGLDPKDWCGSLFDTTIKDFIALRQRDPRCRECKAIGAHVYGCQMLTRSEWSVPRLLGTLCRRLKLDGIVEPMIRKTGLYGHRLLPYGKR